MVKTLVLALGNPLRGDDGIGAAVLATLPSELPGVTLLDGGTPGLELILLLRDYSRVIIIDAADFNATPGSWRRFTLQDLISHYSFCNNNLHAAGLAEALALGDALKILPEEIIIFGIQPDNINWKLSLSPYVTAVIPELQTEVLKLLIFT